MMNYGPDVYSLINETQQSNETAYGVGGREKSNNWLN